MISVKHYILLFVLFPFLAACNPNPSPKTEEKVLVTIDPNGGTISDTKVKLDKGTKFSNSLFPTPTKQDKLFDKWYFADETEIPTDYVINSDINIKASYVDDLSEDEKYIKSLKITPIENTTYLYEAFYDDYDYAEGRKYMNNIFPTTMEEKGFTGSMCSSFYSNNFFGRTFDWKYGYTPEFIMHTTAKNNRHATLGLAFCINLKNSDVNSTRDVYHHKMAPFLTVDGINDAGLCIAINEVDKRDVNGTNTGSNPGKERLNAYMLIRYLLDFASTVKDAEQLLKTQDVFSTRYANESHFMIADATGDCAEIEFKSVSNTDNGQKDIVFIRDDEPNNQYFKNIATNFTFLDYKGDCTNWMDANSSLTPHACGTERYNILYKKLYDDKTSINSLDNVLDLLKNVYYTKTYSTELPDTYSQDFWYSEYHYGTLTKTSPKTKSNYSSNYNYYKNYYDQRHRSDGNDCFYNSLHSCAYDLKNKQLKIIFEEQHQIQKVYCI